ncbi:MAG: transketolase [Pseudomonadota bacterium]|nr:transketolase [Pseudomonadota bacterium]
MEQELANCIRFLSVDAISKANSGHPGMPLGLADVMTVLFRETLRHDPNDPQWVNRDRVVLSNGHGSMLLYSALYLSGYNWTLEELKNFRQLHSHAAGHPEVDVTKGVEVTTGPLGQGIANAVGMAVAARRLGEIYGTDKIDYHTYCFVGDGCLMEGVSHEASALAPKLIQSGLTLIWDDNGISIDGQIDPWFEKDVVARFKSYGFNVIENVDGHDFAQIRQALNKAKQSSQPSFIQMKTVIGKGCQSIEGTEKAHGQPLSLAQISQMRMDMNWPHEAFHIPKALHQKWDMRSKAESYDKTFVLPKTKEISATLWDWLATQEDLPQATRKTSSQILQVLQENLKHLVGGSADLAASNLTMLSPQILMNNQEVGAQNIAYGVREFGMFAIANGLALSGLIPFVATFLTFSDYGRNALRMSALMKQRVVYVFTHDSIGLGEDGPTHQPVEHLAMIRATPNIQLWRPCSLQEVVAAWISALRFSGPTAIVLSRQKIDLIPRKDNDDVIQGAYYLIKVKDEEGTILATGSEVPIALNIAKQLAQQGMHLNVVSVPCLDLLYGSTIGNQLAANRSKQFVIEAGCKLGWEAWAPTEQIFSVDHFGLSAPADDLYQYFGLTEDAIAEVIQSKLSES